MSATIVQLREPQRPERPAILKAIASYRRQIEAYRMLPRTLTAIRSSLRSRSTVTR
jgi:hypothetical protein